MVISHSTSSGNEMYSKTPKTDNIQGLVVNRCKMKEI